MRRKKTNKGRSKDVGKEKQKKTKAGDKEGEEIREEA